MGMNVNRGWFSFKNNWKEQIKFNPQRETQKLEAEPLKPGMQPKRQTPTQTDIQQLLNNLDNPDIPKFN